MSVLQKLKDRYLIRKNYSVILVDGSHMLHRVRNPINEENLNPNFLAFKFIRTLINLDSKFSGPSEIYVLWDKGVPHYRTEIFSEYKIARRSTDDDSVLRSLEAYRESREILHHYLPRLGIYSILIQDTEADDLATYFLLTRSQDKVLLVSEDRDWELIRSLGVGEKINVDFWRPISEQFYSWKYNYPLGLLYKSILGDGSDGVPGVYGVGPKTAEDLVDRYLWPESKIKNAEVSSDDLKIFSPRNSREKRIYDDLDVVVRNIKVLGYHHVFLNLDLWRDKIGSPGREQLSLSSWQEFARVIESRTLDDYWLGRLSSLLYGGGRE